MEKKCSIRLFLSGVSISAALCFCIGFFAGNHRTQKIYEERIVLLKQQNENLLTMQKEAEARAELAESMNLLEPCAYILLAEEGYVAVYYADEKTLYAVTDIRMDGLPEDLQAEISQGKSIRDEEQLYNFLENYTS